MDVRVFEAAGLTCGGLARGYGDLSGLEVNLAAQLVKIANPGALLEHA